ncbi:monooxygenase [Citrobacter braakii]|uniref:monooxygenase n=1 Tax=Citrobacter braakii TaxID=57706 RepID=UPI002B24AAF2|nr:monooxygenase [Citrobacter braakii]MEB2304145.1 monooxygenase [Citrobacter braakii]
MANKLVQIHFDFPGPFGAEMSHQLVELAESINQEPGFIWKIWTENAANHEAGGIYLFQDENSALAYIKKHTARLKYLGVEDVTCKIFDINEPLSKINHGHIG